MQLELRDIDDKIVPSDRVGDPPASFHIDPDLFDPFLWAYVAFGKELVVDGPILLQSEAALKSFDGYDQAGVKQRGSVLCREVAEFRESSLYPDQLRVAGSVSRLFRDQRGPVQFCQSHVFLKPGS